MAAAVRCWLSTICSSCSLQALTCGFIVSYSCLLMASASCTPASVMAGKPHTSDSWLQHKNEVQQALQVRHRATKYLFFLDSATFWIVSGGLVSSCPCWRLRKLPAMPARPKSLADRAAEEIAARKARDAARAHLSKAGQSVGTSARAAPPRLSASRDNTLRMVQQRSKAQAAAKAQTQAASALHARPRAAPVPVTVDGLPAGWKAARVPPDGPTYYYDAAGASSWRHPATRQEAASQAPTWRPVQVKDTGAVYWWNTLDGRVTWQVPADVDVLRL